MNLKEYLVKRKGLICVIADCELRKYDARELIGELDREVSNKISGKVAVEVLKQENYLSDLRGEL